MSQGDQRSERPDRDRGRAIDRGGTTAAQCREIELQFQLPPPSSALLEASALLAGVAVTRLDQHTTYFDTRDETLRATGYTLRVRTCARSYIPAVKRRASQCDLAIDSAEGGWLMTGRMAEVDRLREVPGLSERDVLTIKRLLLEPEAMLGRATIAHQFDTSFFKANFRLTWCPTFAFQPWHGANEFKRCMVRSARTVDGFDHLALEYSVRSAQRVVYQLLDLRLTVPPVYKGKFDPRIHYGVFIALDDGKPV
jgi:hypothetical protein